MSEQRPALTMPATADPAVDGGTLADRPTDDWSTRIETWASTAQSGPLSNTTKRDPE
jgi:hypothetical protein